MGGCASFLKAARAYWPKIMPSLALLSAFIILVHVLGGAPGQEASGEGMISIHNLSELERLKLQETAYHELVARRFLSEFKPERAVPDERPSTLEKWFKILRGQENVDSLKTFGVPLEEVLVNELTRRKHRELIAAAMQIEDLNLGSGRHRRGNSVQRMIARIRRFFNRHRAGVAPTLPQTFTRRGRRGGMSADNLSELEDGALLLQTLQLTKLSFPIGKRLLGSKRKMSLNPIARQIPYIVEACCSFLEKHALHTVGLFTTEYSEETVRKLREKFEKELDVVFEDDQNVTEVAALLKEFFRDMKDSLLPDDLYMSFLLTATLKPQDQLSALQLLVYLMPPCHSDTLERLLKALHKLTEHCEDSIGADGQLVFGNRMTSTNLALVFGTALLKKGKAATRECRKTKLGIDHYVASVNVVRAMIDNWDVLFQVPPHIQKQVAKRVWKTSPEALDFIRRRNLRKIQSAQIKMEEDAMLSDPVETPADIRAAVLGPNVPLDEGQFNDGGHALAESIAFPQGQFLGEGQVLPEDESPEEDESSEEDLSVNEELAFEYFHQGVVFGEVQGLEVPHDLEIQIPHLEDIPELDEEEDDDDDDNDEDDDDTLNFDDFPALQDILEAGDEIPGLIEIPDFEEIPHIHVVPEPAGVPDVQEIANPGENPNHDLEEGADFEDHQNLNLAEVPYLDVIPNNVEALDNEEIPNNEDAPDHADALENGENPDSDEDPDAEEVPDPIEIPNHEDALVVNGIFDSEEDLDFEAVPALHVIPSPEEIANNHIIPNHEELPELNGLSDSEEDPDLDEFLALDEALHEEEASDVEEIQDLEETAEVSEVVNSEEVPALHLVTSSEDASDSDVVQDQEESSEVSGDLSDEEASDTEEFLGHANEKLSLEEHSVLSVLPESEHVQINNEVPDFQKDQVNTFEEDEGNTLTPEPEDVSILNTIPDPQPDLTVSLEEILNVEAVPVQNDLDTKEVQNTKTDSFEEILPTSIAGLFEDEEGAGNTPMPEYDVPMLNVPMEEIKSGKSYNFP